MLIWGQQPGGGRYDPATDTWKPMSSIGAPPATTELTCTWTGSELFVFGGMTDSGDYAGSLGLYDPVRDAWRPVQAAGAPKPRFQHSAVFTGRDVIVWGGQEDPYGDPT